MRPGRLQHGGPARWAVLGRPWFLAAVAVLAANDHVLKLRHPGVVTGKVSDFAGPVVVAALLAVIVGRTAAVAATAAGFVALKTVPGAAEVVEPLLGGVTRRDATDLVGLVALAPAWWALGRHRPTGPLDIRVPGRRLRAAPTGAPVRPSSHAPWLGPVAPVGGAVLALFALTATSAADPHRVHSLHADGTRLFAEVDREALRAETARWAISHDGGLTWEELDGAPPAGAEEAGSRACRADGRCFEARGEQIVEVRPDGGSTTSFAFDDGERELLDYRRKGANLDELFSAALVAAGPDGEHVVVASGDQGVTVMTPDGDWQRVGVLDAGPTSVNGAMWPLDVMTFVLLGSLPVALLVLVARSFRQASGAWMRVGAVVGGLIIAVAVWGVGIGAWALGTISAHNPVVLALVLLPIAVAVVALPLLFVARLEAETARPGPPAPA